MEDIAKSKNGILSNGIISQYNDYPDIHIVDDKQQLLRWREVFQRYFSINNSMLNIFRVEKQKLFGENRILGVLARGTDYINLKPRNHPIQPTVSQIIEKTEEVMDKYRCTYIFLATEDQEIFNDVKRYFGDKLLALDMTRYVTLGKQNINDMCSERNNDKYLKGREYLLSIWLLSQCNCLVAGNVGGTHGALLMSPGYDYSYVFDLGLYS